ncbi:MAG TPA: shikimate dehydrogenase [Thermodesulfobacteriota bacterium]|nr:shikimate dehydrogenase [Thermodesulfobacteriota bacterium]
MKEIDAKTKICVLIGDPVEHSFSPLIHNAGFNALGINFVYVACLVKDLEHAVKGIRALNIRGASITIPHKVKAISYVDRLDDVAQKIGSINTIVNQGGQLIGYNSDGIGALKAFQDRRIDQRKKTVLILGSGGVARAIAFSLIMHASLKKLSILGIIPEELDALVSDLSKVGGTEVQGGLLKEAILQKTIGESEIVINCTPVGMHPKVEASPVPGSFLRQGLLVFDVVYNPPQTTLLKAAQKIGCMTISGLEMFINQAIVQFELWTGEKAPVEVMKKILLERIARG